jgi:succinate dehydrogenase subunit D
MRNRSNEPILWILFSAGGVIAAMLLPMLMILFGIVFPLGWWSPPGRDALLTLVAHPLARIGAFVVCLLSFVHAAHRFRYTLYDGLQIKHLNEVINTLCYGGAIVGSVWAAYVLWRIP